MNISTMPAIGSLIDARSASMGADTWATATRKMTTRTSFDKISATTNAAHFPNHPFVVSHAAPARAIGPKTIATRRSALRIRSENHTMAAALIARPARKIVTIAPTPGVAILIAASPATRRAIRSPMPAMVLPVA
nr:hypothetical protein GCM10025699_17090 [Microbacterium flavescens]